MPLYCEKTGAPSPNYGSCTCAACWANNEIVRMRAALEKISNIANEFGPEYPDPADALVACEQEANRALGQT